MATDAELWKDHVAYEMRRKRPESARFRLSRWIVESHFFARSFADDEGIHTCELSYYRSDDDNEPVRITIRVCRVEPYLRGFGWPYSYQFIDGAGAVGQEVVPQIRVVAAPGVSVSLPEDFDEWPQKPDWRHPSIRIFRVQEPLQVPDFGSDIVELALVPDRLVVNGEDVDYRTAREIRERDDRMERPESKLPHDCVLVQSFPNATFLYCTASSTGVIIRVAPTDISKDQKRIDAFGRYSYALIPGGTYARRPDRDDPPGLGPPSEVNKPLGIICSTPNVSLELVQIDPVSPVEMESAVVEPVDSYIRTLNKLDWNHPFYFVRTTYDEFLHPEGLVDAFYSGAGTSVLPVEELEDDPVQDHFVGTPFERISPAAAVAVALYVGASLVARTLVSVTSFVYATFSGKSLLGRKLTFGEYVYMFISLFPLIPGATRSIQSTVSRLSRRRVRGRLHLGGKQAQAVETKDELLSRITKVNRFVTLARAVTERLSRGNRATKDALSKLEPLLRRIASDSSDPRLLLDVSGSKFLVPALAHAYGAYVRTRDAGEAPLSPEAWIFSDELGSREREVLHSLAGRRYRDRYRTPSEAVGRRLTNVEHPVPMSLLRDGRLIIVRNTLDRFRSLLEKPTEYLDRSDEPRTQLAKITFDLLERRLGELLAIETLIPELEAIRENATMRGSAHLYVGVKLRLPGREPERLHGLMIAQRYRRTLLVRSIAFVETSVEAVAPKRLPAPGSAWASLDRRGARLILDEDTYSLDEPGLVTPAVEGRRKRERYVYSAIPAREPGTFTLADMDQRELRPRPDPVVGSETDSQQDQHGTGLPELTLDEFRAVLAEAARWVRVRPA